MSNPRQNLGANIWRGASTLVLMAILPCQSIDPTYFDLPIFHPEKNVKFESEGDHFYQPPQLKDFGLTKAAGHYQHHKAMTFDENYFRRSVANTLVERNRWRSKNKSTPLPLLPLSPLSMPLLPVPST